MQNKPKIGILIPFYKNPQSFTNELLTSIAIQTYENIVLYILVDEGLKGNHTRMGILNWTVTSLEALKFHKSKIKHIHLPVNVGTFRAYNMLGYVAYADKCDYVIPVGQDDILMPECIETMVEKALENDYSWVNIAGEMFGEGKGVHQPQPNATYESAWKQNPLTSFALFKMSVWKEYNGYDVSITPDDVKVGIEDCELWLRLLRDGHKYAVISKPLYFYRVHKNQAHRIPAKYGIDKLYKIIRKKHNYYS